MKLELPQGSFFIDESPFDTVLLVGGGRPPDASWLKRISQTYPVWAIDRGVDVCRSAVVIPEMLIGDADSGAAASWDWAGSLRIPVLRHPADKDWTDLQLGLKELGLRRPGSSVLLTGGMGRRFDHAYSNVFSLQEAQTWGLRPIGLADESEALFLLEGGQSFQADLLEIPLAVSLLPLSADCEHVTSSGVHWPLHDARLAMDRPGGICNRLAEGSSSVMVSVGRGLLGVYFCWKENGL